MNLMKVCHTFDGKRASASTFVWIVTDSHFKDIAAFYNRKRRAVEVMPIDALEPKPSKPCEAVRFTEILQSLETMTDLRLDKNVTNARLLAYVLGYDDFEIRQLCRKHSTSELANSQTIKELRAALFRAGIARDDIDKMRAVLV